MMALNGSNGRIHRPLHVIKTLGEGMHGKVVLAMDPISGKQVFRVFVLSEEL